MGIKLNLGCGSDIHTGFVNIDVRRLPGVDVVMCILKLPFKDSTVEYVLLQDILEHFTIIDGQLLLNSCSRVMKTGAEILIRVPNLPKLYELYKSGVLDDVQYQQHIFGGQDYPENFHKSGYTPKLLSNMCIKAGIKNNITITDAVSNFCLLGVK